MTRFIIMVLVCLNLTACSQHSFETIDTQNSFSAKAFYNPDVDVLWVIDNSHETMEAHQNRIASKMNEFYQGLLANKANFRIAATTMDMSSNGDQGNLLGSVPVVTKTTPNGVARLEELLKRGGEGANLEQGLRAMKTTLQRESLKGKGSSFLREDALLVIVFVTDDEDFSSNSVNSYKELLDNIKGENTLNNQKWVANYIGITDLNDPRCTTQGGYSARGERYLELASLSGGIVESICNTDFSSYLDQINVRLKSVLNRYILESRPILDSLTVHINGVLIRQDVLNGWTYEEEKNVVVLNGSAKPGPEDDVEIKYEIKEL